MRRHALFLSLLLVLGFAPVGARGQFLGYSVGVTDVGAPSDFGFTFGVPIAPLTGPFSVLASVSYTLTDADGNGVTLTPLPPGVDPVDGDGIDELQVNLLGSGALTNAGIDVGIGGTGVGGAGTYSFGPFSLGPQAGPAGGPFNWMQVDLYFRLSGGGDSASITGQFQIVRGPAVPEPGALALLAGAAVPCAALALRRRRR